jgi:NAD(P)-dependent dehydrogenase (short-subunit alcohol dehydrogenase family)
MKINPHNYLITGATSGIGKALVNKLSEEKKGDNKIFLLSRSIDESLEKMVTDDHLAYYPATDLTTLHKLPNIIDAIDVFFPGQFVLIHCAGDFWEHLPFLEVSAETAANMMNSHYGTLYSVLQAVIPLFLKKGGGKIVTFSCNATSQNLPNMLPFTAAKAAVEASIKCIAHEFAAQNIVANAIGLSSLQTEKVRKSKPYGDYDHYINLSDICDTVLEVANFSNGLANGNIINCYEYSTSFYNKGYFERIKKNP